MAGMGGGGGPRGGGRVSRSRRGGGSERRRGARRQWRARAPRLEEEEPGPGGGLTRFRGSQGPPNPARIWGNRPPGTCSRTALGAPGAQLGASTPRRRSGAHATPGTAPRGRPPGLPGGPRFLGGLLVGVDAESVIQCVCTALGPSGRALPPAFQHPRLWSYVATEER